MAHLKPQKGREIARLIWTGLERHVKVARVAAVGAFHHAFDFLLEAIAFTVRLVLRTHRTTLMSACRPVRGNQENSHLVFVYARHASVDAGTRRRANDVTPAAAHRQEEARNVFTVKVPLFTVLRFF